MEGYSTNLSAHNLRMLKDLDVIMCNVTNMDAATAFYRDVLKMTPGHLTPYWSDFKLSGTRFGLHPAQGGTTPSEPSWGWSIGVLVDDIKAFRENLIASGVWVADQYHDVPGGVILDFRDPDGNPFMATQRGISTADLK